MKTFALNFLGLLTVSFILLNILFGGIEETTGIEIYFWITAPVLCLIGAAISSFAMYEYKKEV